MLKQFTSHLNQEISCMCSISHYFFLDLNEARGFDLFFIIISGVGLSPLGTVATSGLFYKPQMIDEGDCGAIGGTKRV
jgi:hypothetical protein